MASSEAIVFAEKGEGGLAYSFRLTITGESERANAQRVAQRYGKDNPEVFIPCRHLHTNFGACVTSVFLTGRRTDTNPGGTQSRRNAAAPRHPTRPKSTGPAPP